MLARRVIAISPDKALGKQLTTALLAAGGAVETHASLEPLGRGELAAALVVVHVADQLDVTLAELLPRLSGDARVIAVLSKSNLAATVDLMQASERVAAVMVAEGFDPTHLSAMATRVLSGDIFGLEKVMPWGTRIHSTVIGDYQEKSLVIAQLSEFAEGMGVRRKYRESIEQSVDEMVMNALYDAPVDDDGRPIFSEIPTRTRISLRVDQKVVVQYACNGAQFAVSVRDAFGTLQRSVVLRFLYKCLHHEQQIDRKAGGAGLGLYLVANNASRLYFNVLPGVATEAIVSCDLDVPKIQLEELGYFTERVDASGRLAAGRSRRLPPGASYPVERRAPEPPRLRPVVGLLAAAIAVMVVLIGVVATLRPVAADRIAVTFTTEPAGAMVTIDGRARGVATDGRLTVDGLTLGKTYLVGATLDGHAPAQAVIEATRRAAPVALVLVPHAAMLTVETDPPGAEIRVDGAPHGRSPQSLATLVPGSRVTIALHKDGYVDAVQDIEVPPRGKDARVVVPLALSPDFASIVITSEPPGARVFKNGELVAGVTTPTDEILVEAGPLTVFTVDLAGRVPVVLEVRPDRGSRRVALAATLIEGVTISVTSNLPGTASIDGAPACHRVAVPGFTCVVRPGDYVVTFEAEAAARAREAVVARAAPVAVAFAYGFVEANAGHKVRVGNRGPAYARLAVEAGRRTVFVIDGDGTSVATPLDVKAGKTSHVP